MMSVCIMMFFLLPFHAVILAVWGRNLWTDWRNPFHSDHSVLQILPVLGVVEMGWSSGTPKMWKS